MAHSDAVIQALDEAIERAEAAQADLETELLGLRMARDRRLTDIGQLMNQALASYSTDIAEWRSLSRTDAVLRALSEADTKSMHRKQLTEKLIALGRKDDTIEAVSAALAYLARNDRVTALGQGWWRIGASHQSFSEQGSDLVSQMTADVNTRTGPRTVHFADNPEGSGMGP